MAHTGQWQIYHWSRCQLQRESFHQRQSSVAWSIFFFLDITIVSGGQHLQSLVEKVNIQRNQFMKTNDFLQNIMSFKWGRIHQRQIGKAPAGMRQRYHSRILEKKNMSQTE